MGTGRGDVGEMMRFQEVLRRLAVIDERLVGHEAGIGLGSASTPALDPKTAALARLAAPVALGSSSECLEWGAGRALAAGAVEDEIADTLLAIVPVAGIGRVVSAAPPVATALDYDVEAALEELDEDNPARTGPAWQADPVRFPLAASPEVLPAPPRQGLTGSAEAAARPAQTVQEMPDHIISSLFQVGVILNAAIDRPGGAAVQGITQAPQRLDQTIRDIRAHVFCAARAGARPQLAAPDGD